MKKTNFLLLIAFVFFLMSCRNELDTIQENEKFKTEAKFSLLRKEQINQQVNLLSKLSEIESKGFKTNNILGKSVQDSVLEGAIINTDEVLLAERGEKKTYTFPVYRTNSDKIENLVLKENADKTYSGFLIQYALTKQERDLFISGHDVDIKSKIKIFNIDKLNITAKIQTDVVGCYEITWETGTCSSSYHHAYGDNACVLTGDDAAPKPTIIAIKDICSNYSNQTDSPNTNPNIPNDGSSGSYDTAPYVGSEAELIEMNRVFRLKLSAAQLSWYDAHTVLGIDLAKLYNEDSSVPHLNFLKSLIDYMKTSNNTGDTFLYATIINFLKQEGSYQENWTLISNILAEHDPDLGMGVLNFIKENPDTLNKAEIINRIKALDNALTLNPNLLLDIPCNKIDDWKPMADHQMPQSVKNKLKDINSKTHWYQDDLIIQNLDNAKGKSLNMDLFSVKISKMPNKPGTSEKFTHKEFFDYFRLHLNDFAEKFTPVVDTDLGVNDTALWNSTNPLNALISIYIPVIVGHNNGTVICSGVTSNTWVFTTITSPWDSEHPVSGNRFFSYYINPSDNAMYIYTRGLDRVNLPIFNNLSVDSNPAFNGADELWSGMQAKIKKFVKDHGGTENDATIISPEIYRPDWVKVKDYFKGNKPLSSLGCK
ncbi:hypothetical protein [Chryseobacterium sp. SL1]|uniref:hypothetical protein n=1 Tax=Chryseobacterium sp. SL1 TaxID=2995159 RepID=UPI00227CA984|nr:hypothetical protein [Chryseobacterium sp. SL1]